MNYHVEHHMFPMVPYHALPALHREMLADCATPYSSFWDAYREIVPTLWRQLKDPTHFVHRRLPASETFAVPPAWAMSAKRPGIGRKTENGAHGWHDARQARRPFPAPRGPFVVPTRPVSPPPSTTPDR